MIIIIIMCEKWATPRQNNYSAFAHSKKSAEPKHLYNQSFRCSHGLSLDL